MSGPVRAFVELAAIGTAAICVLAVCAWLGTAAILRTVRRFLP